MLTIVQFLSLSLINILISVTVFTTFSVIILSNGFTDFFPISDGRNPISISLSIGVAIGVLHGLVASFIIYWLKSNFIFISAISSFLSTELLILLSVILILIYFFVRNQVVVNVSNLSEAAIGLPYWFLIGSVLFFIPTTITATLYELLQKSFSLSFLSIK